tara:strand:+ start:330 stop:947 length:618 start_codon:yes stop_codon:yes gene_type:complete
MFLFQYKYKLIDFKDILKIKKISKIKKINLLDFGCGDGSWDQKQIIKKINSIYLYDKNKDLIPFLKKKYNSRKVFIEFKKNKIFKKKINLIVFSSVIQYMSDKELNMIFSKISKVYKNKKLYIFINDHPLKHRLIELFALPFINLKKFLFSISLIFKIKYLMTRYYSHNIYKKKYIIDNFIIKKMGFINDMKYLRGKFILTLKSK